MAELTRVIEFLKSTPHANYYNGNSHIRIRCPYCGGSRSSDVAEFSIKVSVEDNEPLLFKCFRASCGKAGVLTPDTLQLLGCNDMDTLVELATWNKTATKKSKAFTIRKRKDLEIINVNNELVKYKLQYINDRLGINLSVDELNKYRIQLNLYDFIRGNGIKKLAYSKNYCDALNNNCVGFISMYQDYMILRDCTKNMVTGRRYHMYRTLGVINPDDTKIYAIPTDIDLLSPEPAELHVAEGAFSLLGAYFHTNFGRRRRNQIFLANCGSQYKNTILSTCIQYGLLEIELFIYSDTGIDIKHYKHLIKQLSDIINIKSCKVLYNKSSDDFGHSIDLISAKCINLV